MCVYVYLYVFEDIFTNKKKFGDIYVSKLDLICIFIINSTLKIY